jgi:hypothetical protein
MGHWLDGLTWINLDQPDFFYFIKNKIKSFKKTKKIIKFYAFA